MPTAVAQRPARAPRPGLPDNFAPRRRQCSGCCHSSPHSELTVHVSSESSASSDFGLSVDVQEHLKELRVCVLFVQDSTFRLRAFDLRFRVCSDVGVEAICRVGLGQGCEHPLGTLLHVKVHGGGLAGNA